jgi:hypothetical protein
VFRSKTVNKGETEFVVLSKAHAVITNDKSLTNFVIDIQL